MHMEQRTLQSDVATYSPLDGADVITSLLLPGCASFENQ